ncbi:MAG: hypothetical protein ACLPKT_14870 [Methylocella sp.]
MDTKLPILWSVNAASTILRRDRRSLVKALRDTAPDATDRHGNARWKPATIVSALFEFDRAAQTADNGAKAAIDKLEAAWVAMSDGMKRLRGEPDAERRKTLGVEVGPLIGALDRAFERTRTLLPADETPLNKLVNDQVVGRTAAEFFDLIGMEIDRASEEGIQQ